MAISVNDFEGYPNVQAAVEYAVNLRRPKKMYKACRRFLEDFEHISFPYEFDPAAAEKACNFIQKLVHVKGKWATKKQRFILEPWQKFIVCNIFGWVKTGTDLRRFKEVYLQIPRKSGKTFLAVGIALYIFATDQEEGCEIYSAATTEDQAGEIWIPAKQICDKMPSLREKYGITTTASSIIKIGTLAKFVRVIGQPKDGSSPSLALLDEVHQMASDAAYSAMKTGQGAREQPLLIMVTTAGTSTASFCYEKFTECVRVLDKIEIDEELFTCIWDLDPNDPDEDWKDFNNVIIANPNYGISVSEDFLRSQHAGALKNAAKQNAFLIKHCNLWVNAATAYLSMSDIQRASDPNLDESEIANRAQLCIGGLDFAAKLDFCALVRLYVVDQEDGKHFYAFSNLYLPSETVMNSSNSKMYSKWLIQGHLIQSDGFENNFIEIMEDLRKFPIDELGYDPHNMNVILQVLQDSENPPEFVATEVAQNVKQMSPALKELEASLKSSRFHFDGNPIIEWMLQNVCATEDKNENVFPFKSNSASKIDGATAIMIALNRALAGAKRTNYEAGNILTL